MIKAGYYRTKSGMECRIHRADTTGGIGHVFGVGIIAYNSDGTRTKKDPANIYDAGDDLDLDLSSWREKEEEV